MEGRYSAVVGILTTDFTMDPPAAKKARKDDTADVAASVVWGDGVNEVQRNVVAAVILYLAMSTMSKTYLVTTIESNKYLL